MIETIACGFGQPKQPRHSLGYLRPFNRNGAMVPEPIQWMLPANASTYPYLQGNYNLIPTIEKDGLRLHIALNRILKASLVFTVQSRGKTIRARGERATTEWVPRLNSDSH